MAKQRYLNTRMWRDDYFQNLDPSEKLVFIYCLTNPDTNICGIYEIPLKIISTDTGFNREMTEEILARFEKDDKIIYRDGWIAIKNFIKHQSLNPKIIRGIEKELPKIPEELLIWVFGKPIYSLSHSNSNTNSNSNADTKEFHNSIRNFLQAESQRLHSESYYHDGSEAGAINKIIQRALNGKTLEQAKELFKTKALILISRIENPQNEFERKLSLTPRTLLGQWNKLVETKPRERYKQL